MRHSRWCRCNWQSRRNDARPTGWHTQMHGSEDLGKAGWAYAVLIGGDAIGDEGASLTSEGYGPVVTWAAHTHDTAYLGARKHTNNTAELTALAELLRALLSSSQQRAGSRGVVRTDSEYAAACMMGRVTPKTNRQRGGGAPSVPLATPSRQTHRDVEACGGSQRQQMERLRRRASCSRQAG